MIATFHPMDLLFMHWPYMKGTGFRSAGLPKMILKLCKEKSLITGLNWN